MRPRRRKGEHQQVAHEEETKEEEEEVGTYLHTQSIRLAGTRGPESVAPSVECDLRSDTLAAVGVCFHTFRCS